MSQALLNQLQAKLEDELALQDGEPALVLEESAKLAVPTVHMNGTSKKELLEQYKNAFTAVTTAVTELCKSSPHARDYYTQKGDQYPVARKQHESRLKRLNSVAAELESIAVAIIEQGGRN
jgi:hypothetical protein